MTVLSHCPDVMLLCVDERAGRARVVVVVVVWKLSKKLSKEQHQQRHWNGDDITPLKQMDDITTPSFTPSCRSFLSIYLAYHMVVGGLPFDGVDVSSSESKDL